MCVYYYYMLVILCAVICYKGYLFSNAGWRVAEAAKIPPGTETKINCNEAEGTPLAVSVLGVV